MPNSQKGDGGAVSFHNPKRVFFTNCAFTKNVAQDEGGALHIRTFMASGALMLLQSGVLRRCVFQNNTAKHGGALFITSEHPLTFIVKNCTFVGNLVHGQGGALCFNGTSVNIFRSELSDNNSPSGGAIFLVGKLCAFSIINSKLVGNNNATKSPVPASGSAIHVSSAKRVFINSVQFYNNSEGGSLRLYTDRCEIHNCSFKGNTGATGGAMMIEGDNAVVLITNSCFVENKGPSGNILFSNSKVQVQNCYFGKPIIKTNPLSFWANTRIALRSYNNVFTETNSFPGIAGIQGPTPQAATFYIWKTSFQQVVGNKLLPVDQNNLSNQSLRHFITGDLSNVTPIFSPYASGKLNQAASNAFPDDEIYTNIGCAK